MRQSRWYIAHLGVAMGERKLRAVPSGKQAGRRAAAAEQPAKKVPAKRGRPVTRLSSALAEGKSERDMLVVLRSKLAAVLDGNPPVHSLDRLVRQFQQVDAKIRAIDARAEEAEENADDEVEDEDDGGDWDPSQL